ncbi:MAG: hypothetical protein ORN24_01910 [Burkholderiales bacterium]|nr:hypothetical protein [Burkholderiales bacterium]
MKKHLLIILAGVALFGCEKSTSTNQYVGTWRNANATDQTLTITNNDGGVGYSVTRALPTRTIETFPAIADGNTLVVNQQIASTVIHMQGDKLFAKLIPNCYQENCNTWTKVK